jgi:stage V sporulation protein R
VTSRRPLFTGRDWDFGTIRRVHDAIEEIASTELGLDTYPNQIEVITTEQMLDAYSSIGMPLPGSAAIVRSVSADVRNSRS